MRRDSDFILFGKNESDFTYRGLVLLGILYFGSLLAAAVLSPLFFQLVHYIDSDASSYIAGKPYPEYFDRARLLFVVILFPFLFKYCGLNSRRAIGFRGNSLSLMGRWILYGIGMIALIYGTQFIFGAIHPREDWTLARQLEKIGLGILGGLIIGIVEETLFRGLVFRIFYTAFKPWTAIICSSLFFAFLHFKLEDEAMDHIPIAQIGVDDGLVAAWGTMIAFAIGFKALAFLNLTLVGILAHLTFTRCKNIWAPIGIHAGWVMTILSISKTFDETEHSTLFTGTERVADGYLVTTYLVIFILIFLKLPAKNKYSS